MPFGKKYKKTWIECLKKLVMKMYKCQCLSLSHFLMLKKNMLKDLLQKLLGLHMEDKKNLKKECA